MVETILGNVAKTDLVTETMAFPEIRLSHQATYENGKCIRSRCIEPQCLANHSEIQSAVPKYVPMIDIDKSRDIEWYIYNIRCGG